MGPVARMIIYTGLLVLKGLLWLASGLLIVLVVVQYFRGDAHANPGLHFVLAAIFLLVGLVADYLGRKIRDA